MDAILGHDLASVYTFAQTNRSYANADLNMIIRRGAEVGCEVVLDEAFIDFVDESFHSSQK